MNSGVYFRLDKTRLFMGFTSLSTSHTHVLMYFSYWETGASCHKGYNSSNNVLKHQLHKLVFIAVLYVVFKTSISKHVVANNSITSI